MNCESCVHSSFRVETKSAWGHPCHRMQKKGFTIPYCYQISVGDRSRWKGKFSIDQEQRTVELEKLATTRKRDPIHVGITHHLPEGCRFERC